MANQITHKQSSVPGKAPTPDQLQLGELAVNTYDGKVFIKKKVAAVETIVELGAGGASNFGGSPNLDGGHPDSNYGGIAAIDCGVIA